MTMHELRERIKALGITFKAIADRVGMTKQYYSQIMLYEPGRMDNVGITLKGLKRLHKELGGLIKNVEKTK